MTAQEFVTISAKIPRSLREKMRKRGVSPSKLFKMGWDEEQKREQLAILKKKAQRASKALAKISIEDVVRDIREDRDSR